MTRSQATANSSLEKSVTMKSTITAISLGLAITLSSGCGKLCEKAEREIGTPVRELQLIFEKAQTSEAIREACPEILQKIRNLPENAQQIRKLADDRLTETRRSGRDVKQIRKEGYFTAINFSAHLDTLYARAQRICDSARSSHQPDRTVADARKLLTYLAGSLIPEAEEVKSQACR